MCLSADDSDHQGQTEHARPTKDSGVPPTPNQLETDFEAVLDTQADFLMAGRNFPDQETNSFLRILRSRSSFSRTTRHNLQVITKQREGFMNEPRPTTISARPHGNQIECCKVLEYPYRIGSAENCNGARKPDVFCACGRRSQNEGRRPSQESPAMMLTNPKISRPTLSAWTILVEQLGERIRIMMTLL